VYEHKFEFLSRDQAQRNMQSGGFNALKTLSVFIGTDDSARTGAASSLQQQLKDGKASSVRNHLSSTNSNGRCKNRCSVLATTTAQRRQSTIGSEPLDQLSSTNSNGRRKNRCSVLATTTAQDDKAPLVRNHLSSTNSNGRRKNRCSVLATTTAQRRQSFVSSEPLELNEFQRKAQEPVQRPRYNNSSKTAKLRQFGTT
jgi:hypothetical protein